ncbi:MAG: ArsS family sensor histidine kinase [Sulfuricurvum sp.]|nr:ArsS family sensor histidine kinase [Sulfuricurvum sp.]MDP3021921.1 ArsS family sensor histidine kinase [Sulfuricurvum sp.]
MIARRHSVFFKLHSFFIIASIVLILLLTSAYHEQEVQRQQLFVHRSIELSNTLTLIQNHTCKTQDKKLQMLGYQSIDSLDSKAKRLILPNFLEEKLRLNDVSVSIYRDSKGVIYALAREHCTMFYRDTAEGETYYFVWFLFFALMGGLISMYLLLWRNLLPLKHLYEQIKRYGEGEKIPHTISNGKDEIALISNAFYRALEKQDKLKSSRELFLRNIMHELKTPIMKGKLIVELEQPSANTTLLGKLFSRMEHLIIQMAQIEKMHAFHLQRTPVPIASMITTAIERLVIHHAKISSDQCNQIVTVDQELFTSALQNLIDNAVRHATALPIRIQCDERSICIQNYGEPLKRPVEEALEAFVTERNEGGLGLGLYIAQAVCEMHGFALDYTYEHGAHNFCIRF